MEIRPLRKRDYPHLEQAWKDNDWIPVPYDLLPRTGFVAFQDGAFVAYLGMYIEKGKLAIIEWALKGYVSQVESDQAFSEIFTLLVKIAKEKHCRMIFSFTKASTWGKKLLSFGMQPAETGACSYIMALDQSNTDFMTD